MAFGWELVVLHTLPSMFGKFWCMLGGMLEVWMKNRLLFIQIQPLPSSMHNNSVRKSTNENNRDPTLCENTN